MYFFTLVEQIGALFTGKIVGLENRLILQHGVIKIDLLGDQPLGVMIHPLVDFGRGIGDQIEKHHSDAVLLAGDLARKTDAVQTLGIGFPGMTDDKIDDKSNPSLVGDLHSTHHIVQGLPLADAFQNLLVA